MHAAAKGNIDSAINITGNDGVIRIDCLLLMLTDCAFLCIYNIYPVDMLMFRCTSALIIILISVPRRACLRTFCPAIIGWSPIL